MTSPLRNARSVHATIPKWVFDKTGKPYQYSCDEPIAGRTPANSGTAGPDITRPIVGRHLSETEETAAEDASGWNRLGDPLLVRQRTKHTALLETHSPKERRELGLRTRRVGETHTE